MSEVIAGRYELTGTLGSGGMAHVFAALDRRLGRRVAVKLLEAGDVDRATRARFVRESHLAAAYVHPNVVTVYDAGEDDGTLYIVMELVDGPSLAEVLSERGRLDVDEAVAIGEQVLDALAGAHRRGIVHRDVKPGNILLAGGVAKLADFGIAQAAGPVSDPGSRTVNETLTSTLSVTGNVVGTARYLPPERLVGSAATPASDVYSVGVTLFEMLAGEPPFSGDSTLATALAHRDQPVPDLLARRPDIDRVLAGVIARALAKDPAERYPDAGSMRVALASRGTTFGAANRRRRAPAIAALLVAVVAAGIALVVGLGEAERGVGSPSGRAVPTSTGPATPTTNPPATPTTTPTAPSEPAVPTTSSAPTGIGALADALARAPGVYGTKQPDLLDKLRYVQQQTGAKRVEEAGKLVAELSKWSAEGELDPGIAAEAVRTLQNDRGG